ncbi:MAG: hypothetical protein JXA18_05285 [Chitinispirillaceae bacterium]|nr:hypothetical protein [Chitinispirillaceae bacterium]
MVLPLLVPSHEEQIHVFPHISIVTTVPSSMAGYLISPFFAGPLIRPSLPSNVAP